MTDALRVLALLALIGANAFFVVAEYAVVTTRRSALAQRSGRAAAAALRLMSEPVRVISTVQVGITALGIVTGAVAEPLVGRLLGESLPTSVSFVLAFAVVTYLSVVLGELVPKALALDRAERLVLVVARPVEGIGVALRPVVWVLERSASLLLKPFGIDEVVAGESIRSADELRALVDEAESAGVIPQAQEELLHNVFDFVDREARDIMVPAADVAWLDAGLAPAAALDRAGDRAQPVPGRARLARPPRRGRPRPRAGRRRAGGAAGHDRAAGSVRPGRARDQGRRRAPARVAREASVGGRRRRRVRRHRRSRDHRGHRRGDRGRDRGRVRPA